jgi:hypothetical protein
MIKHTPILALAVALTLAGSASAQIKGPSTASTPYVLPVVPGLETISLLTVDNTGANPDDVVSKIGGGSYGMDGIPDGLGAFDNGDGTFTLLMNHELGGTVGVTRAHGGIGAYVTAFVISKSNLAVLSGEDLMKNVYGWNTGTQASNPTPTSGLAFFRFCSADLPAPTAYYNAESGLGTTARIFMNGEEDTTHGWAMGHVASGPSKGNSYILGKFNLAQNGSGINAVGAWESVVACPFAQDKTVVIGLNDGGTGIMNNALSVYVGTKTNTGSEVDKAGLTNGTLKHVVIAGIGNEISDANTRTTAITNGTRFALNATASTVFSRPEDGAWNPKNPREFYFVTTDRLDQVSDGLGSQIGQSRLWRLTFDDLSNPDLGGKIDLLIDGRTVGGEKVNMFDNICVNEQNGHVLLQEDVGGAPHNGKVWEYDPVADTLVKILKHDPARFGDRIGGTTTAATAPFTNDEETTGIIDITAIMANSGLHRGYAGEAWYISSDQAHYSGGSTGITSSQVEGGQLFVVHDIRSANGVSVTRGGFARDRRTGGYSQVVTLKNDSAATITAPIHLVVDGLSANAAVTNASGTTTVNTPLGSPYLTIPSGDLAPGASVTATLQFSNPSNAAITYTTRVLSNTATP